MNLEDRAKIQGTVDSRPFKPRKHSLTLLPAVCFLEPDPLRRLIKQLSEPATLLAVKTQITGPLDKNQRWKPELDFWSVPVLFYGMAILYQIIGGILMK